MRLPQGSQLTGTKGVSRPMQGMYDEDEMERLRALFGGRFSRLSPNYRRRSSGGTSSGGGGTGGGRGGGGSDDGGTRPDDPTRLL